jgi:hypothetical protein
VSGRRASAPPQPSASLGTACEGCYGRGGDSSDSPRFCPLLPQKSSCSDFFFERANERRIAAAPSSSCSLRLRSPMRDGGAAAPSSSCSLRSRPSILPASAAEEQQQRLLLLLARFATHPPSPVGT